MILLLVAAAFFLVFLLTPAFGDYLRRRDMVGVDVNKQKRPKVPEQAGLLVVLAVLAAYSIYAVSVGKYFLLANVYAVLLVSLFGFLDHYRHFRPKAKLLVPLLIGTVVAPLASGVAYTHFGTFYSPIVFMLLFAFSFSAFSNLTNMLAGFNGMETGLSAIAAFSLGVISMAFSDPDAAAFSFIFFAALAAFWLYNRYPAKVFPGDGLTLSCGAAFTLIAFQSGLEFYLFLLLLPHIADAALKFASAGVMSREDFRPVRVREGKLYVGHSTYLSICRLFLLQGPLAERKLVGRVLLLGSLAAAIAILAAYGGMR